MRKYQMIPPEARINVDLRDYKNKIVDAVKEVMPFADVVVEKDHYTVDPSPYHSQAIRIGRSLSKIPVFRENCVYVAKTFYSEEVVEEVDDVSDTVDTVKEDNTFPRQMCLLRKTITLPKMNSETIEFRIFRGTLKLNTLLATLQMVNQICDVALFYSDEEVKNLSWTDFMSRIEEPELIQYLKERRLYINDAVGGEEDL